MLLTLSQPSPTDFGTRFTHSHSHANAHAHDSKSPSRLARSSTKVMNDPLRNTTLPASYTPTMSTHHRGLPPPSSMTLPDPGRPPPPPPPPPQIPPSHPHALAALPDPPRWQGGGSETDQMRNWLATKAEEEKRRQEEERTSQERLKLEQRRIEHAMLQDSLNGQIPPHMVPMIFAGIGGANLANISLEALQQWTQQIHLAHQQLQHDTSPEMQLRRESRSVNQPVQPYALQAHPQHTGAMQQPAPPPPPPPMSTQHTTFSAYQPQRQPSPPPPPPPPKIPSQHPPSAARNALPRLTTGDMQVHAPPTAPSSAHPLHQTQTVGQQEHPTSSPSIYFHHWVPPTSQADKGNAPQTPVTGPGTSHLSESDHANSPRKRKNQSAHQPAPVPSGPSQSSPPFSSQSSFGRKGVSNSAAHGRRGSKSSREGESGVPRITPARRDSGAPYGSQVDFVVNVAGGPPPPDQRQQQQQQQHHDTRLGSHPQHNHTAPSSPKREFR